jgi:hypothetical protein
MFERAVLRLVAVHFRDLVPEKKSYQSEARWNSPRLRWRFPLRVAVAREAAIGGTPAKHRTAKKTGQKKEGRENAYKAGESRTPRKSSIHEACFDMTLPMNAGSRAARIRDSLLERSLRPRAYAA